MDDVVEVDTVLADVTPKSGRSGDFVVATWATTFVDPSGAPVGTETQDVVYLSPDAGQGQVPRLDELPPADPELPMLERGGAWSWSLRTDPTKLMRFSAATSNAHRIHYDLPYTRNVEKYPGLVVHGPLMTLSMLEVVRREVPDVTVGAVRHRNLGPLFCGEDAVIHGVVEGPPDQPKGVRLELRNATRSVTCVRVDVAFRQPSKVTASWYRRSRG